MAIVRVKKPYSNFLILDKRISEDYRLPYDTRGMLIMLLGKPDNWEVSVAHLAKAGQCGRDRVQRMLKQLIDAGYAQRVQRRDNDGQITGMDYHICESGAEGSTAAPTGKPKKNPKKPSNKCDLSPEPENPVMVNEAQTPPTEKNLPPEPDLPEPEKPAPANPHLISIDNKQELSSNNSVLAGASTDGKPSSAVDNSRELHNPVFQEVMILYQASDPVKAVFGVGVRMLTKQGVADSKARSYLGKLRKQYSDGEMIDALVTCLLVDPVDVTAYLVGCLKRTPRQIDLNWQPKATTVTTMRGQGMPEDVIRDSLPVFVMWFREQEIGHHDFDALFIRWCDRQWQWAEAKRECYRAWLAKQGGFGDIYAGVTHG